MFTLNYPTQNRFNMSVSDVFSLFNSNRINLLNKKKQSNNVGQEPRLRQLDNFS